MGRGNTLASHGLALGIAVCLCACADSRRPASTDTAGEEPDGCGELAEGESIARTRFRVNLTHDGEFCEPEEQTRTCRDGVLSDWTGSFAHPTCGEGAPEAPAFQPPPDPPPPPAVEPSVPQVPVPEACAGLADMFEPRPGETCYSFAVHNTPGPDDRSPFVSQPGESYHEFYFAVPWPPGSVASRIGTFIDNPEVAYFQTTFASANSRRQDGDIERNALGDVTGTSSRVLSMAVQGSCPVEFPADVGLALPSSGMIMVQWHHWNRSGTQRTDQSVVQICTVPAEDREHTADITVLGTELLGDGPRGFGPGPQTATGQCKSSASDGPPVTLVALTPQLRDLGTRTEVWLGDDEPEVPLLEEPFDPDLRPTFILRPRAVMAPGESLFVTCHYDNTREHSVPFGASQITEMCYVLALAYPPRGLVDERGTPSLLGADNMCW